MDPARKPRSGMMSLIAVFSVVCAFWLVVPHTERYKAYRSEREIKGILQAIQPPDGATGVVNTMHVRDVWIAVGVYNTDLKIETLRAHYMQEFSRHGFVYKGEDDSKESQTSLEFCRAGYSAEIVFSKPQPHPDTYTIFLNQSNVTC